MRVMKSILRTIWMTSLAVCLLLICSSDSQAGIVKRIQQRRVERAMNSQTQYQPQSSIQTQACGPTTSNPSTLVPQYIYSTPTVTSTSGNCANGSCSPAPRQGWFR